MIPFAAPGPSYDANNESQFRAAVRQADGKNLKSDVAIQSFIMIDQDDQKPYRVTLESGVLVFTELTP